MLISSDMPENAVEKRHGPQFALAARLPLKKDESISGLRSPLWQISGEVAIRAARGPVFLYLTPRAAAPACTGVSQP